MTSNGDATYILILAIARPPMTPLQLYASPAFGKRLSSLEPRSSLEALLDLRLSDCNEELLELQDTLGPPKQALS